MEAINLIDYLKRKQTMKATFTGNGERVTLTDNERDLGHGKQIEVICSDGSKIWSQCASFFRDGRE